MFDVLRVKPPDSCVSGRQLLKSWRRPHGIELLSRSVWSWFGKPNLKNARLLSPSRETSFIINKGRQLVGGFSDFMGMHDFRFCDPLQELCSRSVDNFRRPPSGLVEVSSWNARIQCLYPQNIDNFGTASLRLWGVAGIIRFGHPDLQFRPSNRNFDLGSLLPRLFQRRLT